TTVFVWTVYLTPLGSVMGFLPIRDIVKILFGLRVPRSQKPLVPLQRCELKVRGGELPNYAENLAANTLTARLTSGHDTLRSRHNRDAQPALNAANLILADVHTAAGARNALQVADDSLIVRAVLQVNAQLLLAVLLDRLVVGNVALLLEDAGNLCLQPRGRNVELLVTRTVRVADAGQKICYWIGQIHRLPFTPRSLLHSGEPAGMFAGRLKPSSQPLMFLPVRFGSEPQH